MAQPNQIAHDTNLTEALGFLKDWVTALSAIESAAIGAVAAYLHVRFTSGKDWP
jgi:hypothetical protein